MAGAGAVGLKGVLFGLSFDKPAEAARGGGEEGDMAPAGVHSFAPACADREDNFGSAAAAGAASIGAAATATVIAAAGTVSPSPPLLLPLFEFACTVCSNLHSAP